MLPMGGAGDYYDNGQANPEIYFDLGSDVTLGEISTWGYATGNTNGGKDFFLEFATDAEGGDPGFLGDESYGSSITFSPSFEAAFSPSARDSHVFGQMVSARYVRMTVTDNWRGLQGALPGGDRVGFGEVAFLFFPSTAPGVIDITACQQLGNGNFEITFASTNGTSYGLQRSVDMENWTTLSDTVTGGAGATSVITDTNPSTEDPSVFYRVIETTP